MRIGNSPIGLKSKTPSALMGEISFLGKHNSFKYLEIVSKHLEVSLWYPPYIVFGLLFTDKQ